MAQRASWRFHVDWRQYSKWERMLLSFGFSFTDHCTALHSPAFKFWMSNMLFNASAQRMSKGSTQSSLAMWRWFVITTAELQMFGTPAVFCQRSSCCEHCSQAVTLLVQEAASGVISFLRSCSERFENSCSNVLFNHPLVGTIRCARNKKNQCTEFCRQSDGEWKQYLLNVFQLCWSQIQKESHFKDGGFSLFLFVSLFNFFPSFPSLWYLLLWTFVICKACPYWIFEKFTFCFPLATILPPDPTAP